MLEKLGLSKDSHCVENLHTSQSVKKSDHKCLPFIFRLREVGTSSTLGQKKETSDTMNGHPFEELPLVGSNNQICNSLVYKKFEQS